MDIKKIVDAHADMAKCLSGGCEHKGVAKCMEKIAKAHASMGAELAGEAEKVLSARDRDIIQKVEALDKSTPLGIRKAASLLRSTDPVLVD